LDEEFVSKNSVSKLTLMKNTSICPKCQSNDILRIPGEMGYAGSGNNIPIGLKAIMIARYLCCSCGFSEEWIDSEEDIEKLEKKYKN
jgi:hypothetical protein